MMAPIIKFIRRVITEEWAALTTNKDAVRIA
jgi:hypothetical protein